MHNRTHVRSAARVSHCWDADGNDRWQKMMLRSARTVDALRPRGYRRRQRDRRIPSDGRRRQRTAVRLLRQRKGREEKPFAVMCPSLDVTRSLCQVAPLEERLLTSPESPIVLLRRRTDAPSSLVCDEVAPHNPTLGVMLPYAPLHHLLLHDAGVPLIATSGNRSDEPICTDEHEALERLRGIADLFLVHNRPIARHVDDSIVRIMQGRELVLRRARGYAPLPIMLAAPVPDMLAVGAHLKSTIALSRGNAVFISQHLGDLETPEAFDAFRREAVPAAGPLRWQAGGGCF